MSFDIGVLLMQDGISVGAIYALLAIAVVLVFAVTRILFLPQGDFICFGALTLAALERGQVPSLAWLVIAMASIACVMQVAAALRQGSLQETLKSAVVTLMVPVVIAFAVIWAAPLKLSMPILIGMTVALVAPLGPLVYKLAFRRLADAPMLVLLIVAVAVHFVLQGAGLIMFGAEGSRTTPMTEWDWQSDVVAISGQSLIVVIASALTAVGLFLYFAFTRNGRALRATAVNRRGARLVGISPERCGQAAFLLAAILGAVSGILISPTTTIYYDSGFGIGLKGFVGAVIGAIASYPVAALGALGLGILESFASFWASSLKEIIVFTVLIPALMWLSLKHGSHHDAGDFDVVADAPGQRPVHAWLMWGIAGMVLVSAPWVFSDFHVTMLNYVALAALVALGCVLLTGIGGMTSFGQAAFVGIGAYATGYLSTKAGMSPWMTLVVALAITAISAILIGLLTLRLSGHFLPLGTMAWGLALYHLFGNIDALGGHTGLTGIPPISLAGHAITDPSEYYYLCWGALGLAFIALRRLLDSRPGRSIRMLNAAPMAAAAFGVQLTTYRIAIFVVSAFLAAVSGWLFAHMVRFVNPSPFSLNASIEYLFMAVVGGASVLVGAVFGAGVLTALEIWLQDVLPQLLAVGASAQPIAFGVIVIVLLQVSTKGIAGWFARLLPMGRRAALPDGAGKLPLRAAPPCCGALLQVQRVRKVFGGLVAVKDVSFDVRSREIVGLLGPNGAGKSTLFNLVSGVLPLTAGKVTYAGKEIQHLAPARIAALGIARTFQHVQLNLGMSVLENVALGAHLRSNSGMLAAMLRLDRQSEASLLTEAKRQLDRVGLGEEAMRPAGVLALGQQRLVEVARALASDPHLLMLDEPAAGLRKHEKDALARVLSQLRAEGMSVLIVEHDMDFVMRLADRLVVINFGEPIAVGEPREVQSNRLVQEAYLGVAA